MTENFRLILGVSEKIRKIQNTADDYKKLITSINSEKQQLSDASMEFADLVRSWISHHKTELVELEKQIATQEITTGSAE